MLLPLVMTLILAAPGWAEDCEPETPLSVLAEDLSRAAETAGSAAHQDPIVSAVRDVVERILREEADQGPWSSPDGMCLDLAAKWQVRLSMEGIDARIATVDPNRRQPGAPVRRGMEGKFHAFVVIETPGGEPLIVDGSWRQFIAGAEGASGLDEVFVGRLDALIRALTEHQADLRIEIHGDPLLGKRDPTETGQLAYGAGPWASLRELLPGP